MLLFVDTAVVVVATVLNACNISNYVVVDDVANDDTVVIGVANFASNMIKRFWSRSNVVVVAFIDVVIFL